MLSKSLGKFMRSKSTTCLTRLSANYIATSAKPRIEKDTFGPIEVPGDKYWGA